MDLIFKLLSNDKNTVLFNINFRTFCEKSFYSLIFESESKIILTYFNTICDKIRERERIWWIY